MASMESVPSYGRRFGVAVLAGIPGIVALSLLLYASTPPEAVPSGSSLAELAFLSALNPLILLAVACLLGAYAAPRVGLQSYLVERFGSGNPVWNRLRDEIPLAVGIGLVGSVLIIILDILLAPLIAQDLPQSVIGGAAPTVADVLAYAPVRFLYGGVTEELLLRFGLMSTLVFIGWIITGRRSDGPRSAVMWTAIVVAALLFGVGHLPALAQAVTLTPILIARTVLLNAIAGVLFGWLYWRRSLEAAMVSHASFHIPLLALSLIQVSLL